MNLDINRINQLTNDFAELGLLPANAKSQLLHVAHRQFLFKEQLSAAESIHLHIKVDSTDALPHSEILLKGGTPQNAKEGYIKYAFDKGYNFIFSSIPVSQEEKLGVGSFSFPHLDHIGIDIRNEEEAAYAVFQQVPSLAASAIWPSKKQGGEGKKVCCCHVQVNEKFWVYPPGGVYLEFAFGQLLLSKDLVGCDLRPAVPAQYFSKKEPQGYCRTPGFKNALQGLSQSKERISPEELFEKRFLKRDLFG